ncbi:protein bark beetle-like isoform X2 [Macrosteles quadrilineatus]|uniref:protein bark beetle-like isoform X2 n=1 Tax=Macrosteles quadrilineatus TaxID=74068 RepID=UPI0023E15BD5|nr:protein bark beetle-like isoform X2 [Macrosteles quadrilineatus]
MEFGFTPNRNQITVRRNKSLERRWRTLSGILFFLCVCEVTCDSVSVPDANPSWYQYSTDPPGSGTEISQGFITRKQRLEKSLSPFILRGDLVIEREGELVVDPGVEVRFAPMVGITVRGVLTARGLPDQRIVFSSLSEPERSPSLPQLRLVDGPSPLSGRLQILHNGAWRDVCSNSRNWTRADMEVACRQLGWQGGAWGGWYDRQWGVSRPRLLLEAPSCRGNEATLQECDWNSRQLGSGVCDFHPDLGLQCLPYHETSSSVVHHWRGLKFQYAQHDENLVNFNTLRLPVSQSELAFVDIRFAGSGRDYNASSALEVEGIPPRLVSVTVAHSAYNGVNFTNPQAPFTVHNCTIINNRGYGVYINSSTGGVQLSGTTVSSNGADGIRYVHHDQTHFLRDGIQDICTFPSTLHMIFPVTISLAQSLYGSARDCHKTFSTTSDQVLTIQFLYTVTDRNDSTSLLMFDGRTASSRLLGSVKFRNSSRPQSVTTTRNNLFLAFSAEQFTQTETLIRITTERRKWFDLNVVEDSKVEDNNGRGIALEGFRSQFHLSQSDVSHNNHIAGVHVLRGVGYVNISDARIAFNVGDGVNVSFTGGVVNVTRSSLSSNQGFGMAVWLNDTKEPEYQSFQQETSVAYSELFRNLETGLLVGNFCGDSIVNITGNFFNLSLNTAIEIKSCWKQNAPSTRLQIGHNTFSQNKKLGIKIRPAVNMDGVIEFNRMTSHTYGGVLIKNDAVEELEVMPSRFVIRNNEFVENSGVYVVNIGLSAYSEVHYILFTWNFIRRNRIREPFDGDEEEARLIPRSRVAAPLVVSSPNVDVFRNILQNPDSVYEVGSHLEDQSQLINCTFNWLGSTSEEKIFERVFDRKDRYNLAKIRFIPFLLHSSNPGSRTISQINQFVPQFHVEGTDAVGGEVDGLESLRPGEYRVLRDINIRPEGRLTLQPGVVLRFPPGVGMMVAGKLEARGRKVNNVLLTLQEESVMEQQTETETEAPLPPSDPTPVRLLGGRTEKEGRLQVKVGEEWGTVCNYGWTMTDAALVCHQLGLVLNPDDWFLERADIPVAGTSEKIIMSNVQCTEEDYDITQCRAERSLHLENSCTHDQDVGLRCYEPHWAGVRLAGTAERTDLQYVTVQKAGLLDYATNSFKPAIQVDVYRHSLDNVRVVDNVQDGLGVIYSDIYSGAPNIVHNSEFTNNRGSGVAFKQLGLKITGSVIENNKVAGIRHNPALTVYQQREIAGWFKSSTEEASAPLHRPPLLLPSSQPNIELEEGQTQILITQRVTLDPINMQFYLRCKPGFVVGLQLFNPIHNRSTEDILVHDGPDLHSAREVWSVRKDQLVFPTTSTSYTVVLDYHSGEDALGMAILAVSCLRAPEQNIERKIVKGPIPTLTLINSRIKGNERGIWMSFYNRYLTESGEHYLRHSNESLHVIGCDLSHNGAEAVLIDSPHWSLAQTNISEISLVFNNTLITDNGRGILQFSRDLRSSNNLFHWLLSDDSIERNHAGGLELSLPYVWQYNENFTHSVILHNNTWRNNQQYAAVIGGHFTRFNMTRNVFEDNVCRSGLVSVQGMEKQMWLHGNTIERNTGTFMVEFKADSQSEILGELRAEFSNNIIKRNRSPSPETPSSVIVFDGLQKVRVKRNLIAENTQAYSLVAGVRTARIDSTIDVTENWWGTTSEHEIISKIFDFDDWNDHAIANFKPFLIEDSFEGSLSIAWEQPSLVDLNRLSGRLKTSLTLQPRDMPYQVMSDVTVMPGVTLNIAPGVVIEFAPRVGLLVLGRLVARGRRGQEIVMRPLSQTVKPPTNMAVTRRSLRLCTMRNCSDDSQFRHMQEGFLEYLNSTTLQWVPLCDSRFSEHNARVVCRQMGLESLNAWVSRGPRVEFHPNSLTRIWSWPEPVQCSGDEKRLEDCEIRLNGQLHGKRHTCAWNSNFVFVRCGQRNLPPDQEYWGGIRFANEEFEQSVFEGRVHDVVTHETVRRSESVIEYTNITGAGLLHTRRSPAVLGVYKCPTIENVNISYSASHGISLISPQEHVRLRYNWVQHTLGVGVTIASLTGEGRESGESSFTPARHLYLPSHIFGLVDVCDPAKEIIVQERVVLYYKYDNKPVSCVKIFYSAYRVKPFGFRLLQLNMLNSTDSISIYDGDIYNKPTLELVAEITSDSPLEKRFLTTKGPSLSVRVVASGASETYGFMAEIVTTPISAIGFNRDVEHNISYSALSHNWEGALHYVSAGEVNPRVTMEWNQITNNCAKLYGNFTTCLGAVTMDLQNTQYLHFRNNLMRGNQGGLWIRADSRGSATSLKGWIHNNLFTENDNNPALSVEGRQSSPYQEVTIYRNYWARNRGYIHNVITLDQVVSNFTYNYLHNNLGSHVLEVSGFERVRLPFYQTTSHNGFYWNYAIAPDSKGTVIAGTAGQQYVDNIFFNPDNDYEIVTVNRSREDVWKTPIDAKNNYWGFNETIAVSGRIRDRSDEPHLLEVDFRPFQMNNRSILSGKCPPGWDVVGDTCYIYIGAPMTFWEARDFCRSDNASMPYVMGNSKEIFNFLRRQQEKYNFYDRVWVQHIDRINQCTVFVYQTIEVGNCNALYPFVCEMDPKVHISLLTWKDDMVTVAVLGAVFAAILMVAVLIFLWLSKNRHRHVERLQRRNSIRQSLHSVRSIGSSHGGFATINAYKHKHGMQSQSSTPTLNKSSDYKKMAGSLDSMDKSQLNSSLEEETQSYDIYEAHNPSATEAVNPSFDLAYRNQGFRDTSTFASRTNSTWQSQEDYFNNASTLPLHTSLSHTTSTLDHVKTDPDFQAERDFNVFYERPKSAALLETNLDEAPPVPAPPPRPSSATLLETDVDYPQPPPSPRDLRTFQPLLSKSQPLETAM